VTRTILSGGSVVLPDRVVEGGSLVVEDGRIAAVERRAYGRSNGRDELVVDTHGRLVLPGFVDLHNDALEAEVNPRPRVNLPLPFAIATLDRRLAAAGVTTEFHAVFFANMARKERKLVEAPGRARALLEHAASGRALVDHHVLFRVDIWDPASLESVLESSRGARVPLVSLNDHTPGQGQYRDIEVFKAYFREALGRSREDAERDAQAHVDHARDHPEIAPSVLARAATATRERGLILMSHDDDTSERAEQMYAVGARIAEFPVTIEAAERQRALGMTITAGAPNVVRGGSASGNLDADALLERGLVDVLCADYHAPSLIVALLKIVRAGRLGLPEAVRLVTLNAARAVRLDGTIGSLEPGKRADVAVVDPSGPVPTVELTLLGGSVRYHAPSRSGALALVS